MIGTGADKSGGLTRLEDSLIASGLIYWLRLAHIDVAFSSTPEDCSALSRDLVRFELNSVSISSHHNLLKNIFSPAGKSSLQACRARNVSPDLLEAIAARISHSSVGSSLKELDLETDETPCINFMWACGVLLDTTGSLERLHVSFGDDIPLPAPLLSKIPHTIREISIVFSAMDALAYFVHPERKKFSPWPCLDTLSVYWLEGDTEEARDQGDNHPALAKLLAAVKRRQRAHRYPPIEVEVNRRLIGV